MNKYTLRCMKAILYYYSLQQSVVNSYYYPAWLVNYSIQPDHIWVVELSHDGCLFEQFVPALLLLPVERLDSHLNWSLRRASPSSLIDHPKFAFTQFLLESDALRLQFKCVFSILSHLGLYSTESSSWCPVCVFFQFIRALEH